MDSCGNLQRKIAVEGSSEEFLATNYVNGQYMDR